MGTAALPLLPRDVFGLLQQVHSELPAAPALKTLNPHQDATVTALAEWIIPQTDTPGAKAVRVNEFIDLILTEWLDAEDRGKFLAGLANVDTQSRDLFGKDFLDCSVAQQKQMLTVLDEELTELRQADIHASRRRRRGTLTAENSFFRAMKQLTLVGYFTSEEGAKQALHYEVIPSQHTQCATLPEEEEAAK
ncbi:MAG TPA: gluconate 2-dehydrogenase subunit 3 family protein [Terriglobales bacterium]|nr:gluconate 2-dehydrogenase subunit 3 family protein [Terriglobales bacterium]